MMRDLEVTEGQEWWIQEKGAQAYLWHGTLLRHIEFDGECWRAGGWYSYVVLPRFGWINDVCLIVGQLPDDMAEGLRNAKMDPRHAHLNELMKP
jgi:hypothetical protein